MTYASDTAQAVVDDTYAEFGGAAAPGGPWLKIEYVSNKKTARRRPLCCADRAGDQAALSAVLWLRRR
jgi:hypothetical protein